MLDFSQAIQAIENSQNVLVLPSSPPDGDSIGSALAMHRALLQKGKNATVVLSSGVPDILKFLPESDSIVREADLNKDLHITIDLRDADIENVRHEIVDNKVNIIVTPESGVVHPEQVSFPEPKAKYDLIITVDTAELKQLGEFFKQHAKIFKEIPSINIDHHPSNTNFGSINLVDTGVCSTTELLAQMFVKWGIQIDADIATLLLAGIITDTGSFQNSNTTPEAFDAAADLIEKGARQQEIIKHVYKTKQLDTLKLWGRILSSIQVDEANKIIWATAAKEDFAETGTTYEDIGDIIDDLISNAEEAEVALLLSERDGVLHGSIRTTTDARNASNMAATFGGGGHVRAAGFNIENGSISADLPRILEALKTGGQATNLTQPATQAEPTAINSETPSQAQTPIQPEPVVATPEFAAPSPEPEVEKIAEITSEPQVQEADMVQQAESLAQELTAEADTPNTEITTDESFDLGAANQDQKPEDNIDKLTRDFVSKPQEPNS